MAKVMTLDGLSGAHLQEIRGHLAQAELSWWRQPLTLQGLAPSTWPTWLWALGGAVAGALLSARRR
jgi:hypothetical protein